MPSSKVQSLFCFGLARTDRLRSMVVDFGGLYASFVLGLYASFVLGLYASFVLGLYAYFINKLEDLSCQIYSSIFDHQNIGDGCEVFDMDLEMETGIHGILVVDLEIDSAVDFHEKISLLGPWKCFFLVLDVDSSLLEECLPVLDFLESSMRVLLSTLTFQQGSPIYWLLNEHGLVFGLKIGRSNYQLMKSVLGECLGQSLS
ncbi:hypothetical protein Csa_006023 [Cucumis sativus]|uniref:Uncharacterized protein n=1 Tax=Cucumis sativus TaxID=3659 RepID=A0A0A0LKL1_CUCSA|nr:hypothetical protein Csa_006023 [Cucumis sativus]